MEGKSLILNTSLPTVVNSANMFEKIFISIQIYILIFMYIKKYLKINRFTILYFPQNPR